MRFTIVFLAALAAVVISVAPAHAQTAPPKAVTGAATDVTQTTATLNGVVNPNGKGTIWYFDYGPTERFGERTAQSQEIFGSADSVASAAIENLDPGTTYRFRLVAYNGNGETTGAVGTFTTAPNPYALPVQNQVTLTAKPVRVTNGRPTVLSGAVTGPENVGVKVTLQSNPFRFDTFQNTTRTATTDAEGRYSFTVFPDVLTRYRVVAETIPAIKSDFVEVGVRYSIGFKAPKSAAAGSRARLRGTVGPAHDGNTLFVERRFGKKGRFKVVARTKLRPGAAGLSKYSVRVRVRRTAQYRVRVPADAGHLAARSRVRTIKAR